MDEDVYFSLNASKTTGGNMKAKIEDHYAKGRQQLHKIVPLDAPFSLNIEPATFCNLKCNFCIYSLPKEEIEKEGHYFEYMKMETFEAIISQLKCFSKPIKVISFIGTGEPLLHKDLPLMIREIHNNHLAEQIIIVTNGTLLTPELCDQLIDAGVSTIKISVNGLNSEDYEKNCGRKIDFDSFLGNIKYLYEHKGTTQILIKTLTSVMDGRPDQEFYDLYGNYCDRISIERTMPYFYNVEYSDEVKENLLESRYASLSKHVKVCAAPFMRMGIRVDGDVTLCGCRVGITTPNMNIYKTPLAEIWNGPEHKQVLLNVLKERFEGITKDCAECTTRNDFAFEEDNLDPYADEIYERILKQGK